MPEQKEVPLYQQQKATKPLIENYINEILDGGQKKNALAFVAYLRENKMKPAWTLINTWKAMHKGKNLYHINLRKLPFMNDGWQEKFWGENTWLVKLYILNIKKYEEQIMHEGLQDFIWNNVRYCKNCNDKDDCVGRNKIILGKEIKNQCGIYPLVWAYDPDEEAIESIKRLIELEKQARAENKN